MKKTNNNKFKGMTLIEILMVVAILGLLVSLGVPGYIKSRNKSRRDTCINNLRMIENAADQYRIDLNISTANTVDITWLWPSSAGTKSVTSYINKQLKCPVGTANIYVGGANGNALNATKTDTIISANGYPHCLVSSTQRIYPSSLTPNTGGANEHSIESVDN
ncbi:MAG: hypothetical protein ACD_79C00233G0002 [uncultured bacterium]|nr:MAG: hypothetical protein ACD_79C00233G0002 [uncultured bacterium]